MPAAIDLEKVHTITLPQFSKLKSTVSVEEQQRDLSRPCQVEVYKVNVTDENQINEAIADASQKFGRLDYVANAAGITIRHEQGAAYASKADWQKVIDINLTGTFLVLKAAAQIMLKQEPIVSSIDGRKLQRGSIINIGSILGVVGKEMSTGYVASKHGVMGLMKTASEDYAADIFKNQYHKSGLD